ncbi:MAG: hypothetical protein A3F13_01220 [Gammaproteobacteria bacterium RIFCSPHIGHO2_12_FULL_40_19]|nr:MAG: hypothetical protein A3F13_01220 [Gammaproteobacteria bacterium RIFCSPHIGHO2_12_FULL_40_19]
MFRSIKLRRLSILSFITLCLAFLVIGVGAFTRLSQAGLGCPDWPGCYGHLIVPKDKTTLQRIDLNYPHAPISVKKAQIEMGHRYLAGLLGILILSVVVTCMLTARTSGFEYIVFAALLFMLLIYQVFLGLWTVTFKLSPFIVMQHLLVGMTILALLWLIYLYSRPLQTATINVSRLFRFLAAVGFILLIVQVILGAWTSSHYVGLLYAGLSAVHRWGALVVGCALFSLFLMIQTHYRSHLLLKKTSWYLLIFLCVQILLGALNVIFQLPLFLAIAHNLIASMILLIMVTINYTINCG